MSGERQIVIVGAGLGAVRVAKQLRQRGFSGPITVLGAEAHPPYDRPPLSKQVLRGEADSTAFVDTDTLQARWVLGRRAVSLDAESRQILTDDGRRFGYDALILAPGARARSLPGLDVGAGVHVLRTIDDALALRESVKQNRGVIVIGAGFIGCEVAASIRQAGLGVDLVEALPAPLVRVLGPAAAAKVTELHEAHGVRLHLDASVAGVLRDSDGQVCGVELADGKILDGADVVVGIGVSPDVEWLVGSGVELHDGIVCDSRGRTSVTDVFALGDAARWWHKLAGGYRRVEHWTTTADQASVIAATIAPGDQEGEPSELVNPPYFWSDQYDVKIQGIGFIDPSDHVDELTFRDRELLLYSRDGELRGAVGFSIPAAVMRMKSLIGRAAPVTEAFDLLAT